VTNLEEASKLQEDLDRIYTWAKENIMEFNAEKFEVVRYR